MYTCVPAGLHTPSNGSKERKVTTESEQETGVHFGEECVIGLQHRPLPEAMFTAGCTVVVGTLPNREWLKVIEEDGARLVTGRL
jgi:hypothetical protein